MAVNKLTPLALLALSLLGLCRTVVGFYPVGEDLDFLSNDTKAKSDMDRMMLMNTEDPKLRAEAEEAFQEIMRAKRLTRLQECRRTCVTEHEAAAEFMGCNKQCEAAHKPGEYSELPTLHGEASEEAASPSQKTAKSAEAETEKSSDGSEAAGHKPEKSGEL